MEMFHFSKTFVLKSRSVGELHFRRLRECAFWTSFPYDAISDGLRNRVNGRTDSGMQIPVRTYYYSGWNGTTLSPTRTLPFGNIQRHCGTMRQVIIADFPSVTVAFFTVTFIIACACSLQHAHYFHELICHTVFITLLLYALKCVSRVPIIIPRNVIVSSGLNTMTHCCPVHISKK